MFLFAARATMNKQHAVAHSSKSWIVNFENYSNVKKLCTDCDSLTHRVDFVSSFHNMG